ncbi:MAG: hypothetical protein A2Z51_11300 [Deltaproteobacteria bacterium RBG_19FT_COMBO_52_11]|nr:MAG: hypothetical protein A2Z51_11300 [Deltaproteobacteria bacterium RBG_19FT_COMBO_52_11]
MASEFFWPLDMGESSPFPLPQFFHNFGEGKGGGDNGPEYLCFLFSSPSPSPSPASGGEREFPGGNYLAFDFFQPGVK